ncbi:MAG: hypothetical protein HY816_01630 [Candidatus Wallbacteria bacterium]|nr:hypothetical protein [Candidatus Wallbacteria bacterium]
MTRIRRQPGGSGRDRAGAGGMLVLTMVLLLVLLALALGHDRFSSQVLWTSQKSTEGSLATTLAENAIDEARFELGRRVNVPTDPLYLFFRQGQGRRPVDGLSLAHSGNLLKGEAYKRFNFEGEPAEVEVFSQDPFERFGFETRGVLRYFASVTGYPLRNPKDKIVRQVEVRQEFKVALIGPPAPFDRMTLYVHNGHEFLGLDSADEWVNTNKLIKKMKAEVARIEKNRDEQKRRLESYRQYKDELPGYDQVMADLDNMKFDGLRKVEKYEQLYGREMQFPDGPLAMVALNSTGLGFNLHELGSDAWFRLEADWTARKRKADTADRELRRLESREEWDGGLIRRSIADIEYLNTFDQDMLVKRIYPLYFSGCKIDRSPRLIYNVIATDPTPSGGSALAHYQSLLAAFAKDRVGWRQKFFFRVKRGAAGSVDEALQRFRIQQDPVAGVLNGVVYVDNPDQPLNLTQPIPGKLVLIVEGDVRLSNLPKADDRSILTVISYGAMSVEGDVWASLIPRGTFATAPGSATVIHGNLVLDESYHWTGRTPRPSGQLVPDFALTSSAEDSPGNVRIFPDRQFVVLSPTTEARVVNRTGD